MFDFVVAECLLGWAMAIGALPVHQVYARLPTVDWKFFLRHERATRSCCIPCSSSRSSAFICARSGGTTSRRSVGRGFAILARPARFHVHVLVPQAHLVGAAHRVAVLLPASVPCARDGAQRVAHAGRRLARRRCSRRRPAAPGRSRASRSSSSTAAHLATSLLLAFSVGMNIADRRREPALRADRDRADGEDAVVQALRPQSQRRPDSGVRYASVFPLVTARAVAREFTYAVEDDVRVGSSCVCRSAARVRAGSSSRSPTTRRRDRRARGGRRRRRDPGDAGRARAVDRRLLRVDACTGARTRGAGERRSGARSRRRRPSGSR